MVPFLYILALYVYVLTSSVAEASTVTAVVDQVRILSSTAEQSANFTTINGTRASGYSLLVNELNIPANGIIYNEHRTSLGHFRYVFSWWHRGVRWSGTTSCIQIGANPGEMLSVIEQTTVEGWKEGVVVAQSTVSDSFSVTLKKFYSEAAFNTTYRLSVLMANMTRSLDAQHTVMLGGVAMRPVNMTSASLAVDTTGCTKPQCLRHWNETATWGGSLPPGPADVATIPQGAGAILLSGDVQLRGLVMRGGVLIGHRTSCPPGWSLNPLGKQEFKCYKLYQNSSTFDAAEQSCQRAGLSSIDSHLVSIRSRGELDVVKRLCRGNKHTPSYQGGCWIGLRDSLNDGRFSWLEKVRSQSLKYNSTFMDWNRYGGQRGDNVTVSNGIDTVGGSSCIALVNQWQEDPLSLEQGSYVRSGCVVERPYICQIYAQTTKFVVTLNGTASTFADTATLHGGWYVLDGAFNNISSLLLQRSAQLTLSRTATGSNINTLVMEDGCILNVYAPYFTSTVSSNAMTTRSSSPFLLNTADAASAPSSFYSLQHEPFSTTAANMAAYPDEGGFQALDTSSVYIGERYNSIGLLSLVKLYTNVSWNVAVSGSVSSSAGLIYNVTVNARLECGTGGSLNVGNHIGMRLTQGSDLATTRVNAVGASTTVYLQGYSSRLSTYDAFDLVMSHRGPVLGEYTYFDEVEDKAPLKGVFRLIVTDSLSSTQEITQCIPYNVTADELGKVLNTSSLIWARGGVTVRRSGDGSDPEFGFGYTHRIEMDAPVTEMFFPMGENAGVTGAVSIGIYCYGIWGELGCGCAETKVPNKDITGTNGCPRNLGNISRSDPDSCVIPPSITITRLSTLSYTRTAGLGTILVNGGLHRLPPISNLVLGAARGSGIVSASSIDWKGVQAIGNGQIIMAGTSWLGWDSVTDLYFAPLWEEHRRDVRLATAPPFTMRASTFLIKDLGAILTSCPNSNLTWGSGVWSGGIIGGRSTIQVTESLSAEGTLKALRYSNVLWIMPTATLNWTAGNFSLANGANIIVEGVFNIEIVGQGKKYLGEAVKLESADPVQRELLTQDPGRNFNGYYDDNLPQAYRRGWYINPSCGDDCLEDSFIEVRGNASVACSDFTHATFVSPLNLIDQTKLAMGLQNEFELFNGGICGDDVVMTIGEGTLFLLSGGALHMQATCTIRGAGELMVIGGEHDLGLSIDSHITIKEGTMIWPRSRPDGVTITFRGGLQIEHVGVLQVEPWSTSIVVYKEVLLTGNSQVLFPAIGIAGQPSMFDRPDAPDESPRGNLTAVDVMRWESGTIYGKVDIFANKELYLSGADKTIKFLAKLVNLGHCEWSGGDLITAYNGDFLNEGSIQISGNVTVVDGIRTNDFDGSVFYEGTIAPKEAGGDPFALNYHSWDSDFGHLSYIEYVDLRTQFVSRAPSSYSVRKPDNF